MLKAFGAKLVLTPADKGMKGAIAKCNQIAANLGADCFVLDQFSNTDNPKCHRYIKRRRYYFLTLFNVVFLVPRLIFIFIGVYLPHLLQGKVPDQRYGIKPMVKLIF